VFPRLGATYRLLRLVPVRLKEAKLRRRAKLFLPAQAQNLDGVDRRLTALVDAARLGGADNWACSPSSRPIFMAHSIRPEGRVQDVMRSRPNLVPAGHRSPSGETLGDLLYGYAAAGAAVSLRLQRNSLPSAHMRCRITASLRATATVARRTSSSLGDSRAQAFSADHRVTRVSRLCAATNSASRPARAGRRSC